MQKTKKKENKTAAKQYKMYEMEKKLLEKNYFSKKSHHICIKDLEPKKNSTICKVVQSFWSLKNTFIADF